MKRWYLEKYFGTRVYSSRRILYRVIWNRPMFIDFEVLGKDEGLQRQMHFSGMFVKCICQ